MSTTFSPARATRLARFNGLLMVRNRLTLIYAFALPLAALLLLWPVRDAGDSAAVGPVATALLMALLFPVYYNVLSMFVTRRDELVLKRLRSGEARDAEILFSMALPGAVITLAVTAIAAVAVAAFGLGAPANPVLLVLGLLLASGTFAALAFWTASWTQNAEAAQLTSAPILVLAIAGTLRPVLPEDWTSYVDLTPGAAVYNLVQITWFEISRAGNSIGFADTWGHAAQPLVMLAAWLVLAMSLAQRSLRWEPRA